MYYIDRWAGVGEYCVYGWAEGVIKYILHRQVGRGGGVLHIRVGQGGVYYIDGWTDVGCII
jgi:hypothetical protein